MRNAGTVYVRVAAGARHERHSSVTNERLPGRESNLRYLAVQQELLPRSRENERRSRASDFTSLTVPRARIPAMGASSGEPRLRVSDLDHERPKNLSMREGRLVRVARDREAGPGVVGVFTG